MLALAPALLPAAAPHPPVTITAPGYQLEGCHQLLEGMEAPASSWFEHAPAVAKEAFPEGQWVSGDLPAPRRALSEASRPSSSVAARANMRRHQGHFAFVHLQDAQVQGPRRVPHALRGRRPLDPLRRPREHRRRLEVPVPPYACRECQGERLRLPSLTHSLTLTPLWRSRSLLLSLPPSTLARAARPPLPRPHTTPSRRSDVRVTRVRRLAPRDHAGSAPPDEPLRRPSDAPWLRAPRRCTASSATCPPP